MDFKSTRFVLTLVGMAILTTALFTRYLAGSEFVAGLAIVIGIYTTGRSFTDIKGSSNGKPGMV